MNNLWYQNLIKPEFLPHPEVFPIVWGILYFLMFISLIVYGLAPADDKKNGYLYFAIQITLNFLWSPIFFGAQKISLAFAILCFLTVFLIVTIVYFYQISKASAFLLTPYLLWVFCALYLNFEFLRLNSF